MPETFQTVAVLAVALIPGALYFWAFERIAGRWGSTLSDRVLRFVGASVVLHALAAPVTYWLWEEQWPVVAERGGDRPSWWLWALVVLYEAVPAAAGTAVGWGTRKRQRWAQWVTGPDPAPRAWDHLFQGAGRRGWIRLRLKSGSWIGGAYVHDESDDLGSYSAGYPEPSDLYLSPVVGVDPSSGEFLLDREGRVEQYERSGLLVRWEEVEYLEFIDV